jgi:hypothetical protein
MDIASSFNLLVKYMIAWGIKNVNGGGEENPVKQLQFLPFFAIMISNNK